MIANSKQARAVGFGATALVMVLVSIATYRAIREADESNRSVVHTQRVLSRLETVLSLTADAEAASRPNAVSGAPADPEALTHVEAELSSELRTLVTLTSDNPNQQRRLSALRREIEQLLPRLRQLASTRQAQVPTAPADDDRIRNGINAIRGGLFDMRLEEEGLLGTRIRIDQEATGLTRSLALVIIIGALALLAATYFVVERHAAALQDTNAGLEVRVRARTAELQAALDAEQHARREAQTANRLKDEFLMTVSHELRTPLTAIYGWSRMLATGQIREHQRARAIESIQRNAEAQTQLVNDLLDASRATSGKLRLNVRSIDLSDVITAAIDSTQPAADAKNIRVQAVLDPGAGPVSGDPDRLQQVVWNLLANAVKFTPKGGRVQVRLERVSSHLEIVVSDTGSGIAPDFLPYVFDRFRQAEAGTTRVQGGLGLGLAIVRHLVELHGGTVRAESEGPNHGATFRVLLPLTIAPRDGGNADRTPPPTPRRRPDEIGSPRLDGFRVLVADDEVHTTELLGVILENAGAEVRTVQSARDALSLLSEWSPDILLSDIEMPNEDGYSLIQKVRALDQTRGSHTVAVAVTAYARTEDRVRALQYGYDWHVSKPVEPEELTTIVSSLLPRSRIS